MSIGIRMSMLPTLEKAHMNDQILPTCQPVSIKLVPTELVKVCPMGPSLSQKIKDGTATEDEKWMDSILTIHGVLESWNDENY